MSVDPSWLKVSLLLHCDGTNGSTTFTDSSSHAYTVTPSNATVSTAHAQFGTGSLSLNGSAGYLDAPSQAPGTGDFCYEFTAYAISLANNPTLLDNRVITPSSSLVIYQSAPSVFTFYAAGANRASTGALSAGVDYRFAVARVSGVTRFFLDGVQQGSNYADTNNYDHTTLRYGANLSGANVLSGYFDEIRNTVGYGRYSGNYTPAAAAFPDGPPVAIGFTSTTFGSPSIALNAVGFNSTVFGSPGAKFDQFQQAGGFSTTQFGSPRLMMIGQATGIAPTTVFGTPLLLPHAVGFSSTFFGTPSIPLPAVGFSETQFGAPSLGMGLPATSVGQQTQFGTPDLAIRAVGFLTTRFGIGSIPLVATGFAGTTFGTPVALDRNRARSLGVTTRMSSLHYYAFNQTRVATGFSQTRTGIPTAVRFVAADLGRTGAVSAFHPTRFGTPTVASQFTGAASGFTSTVFGAVGSHTSQRLDATGLPPQTQFGTPTSLQSQRATGIHSTVFSKPGARQVLPVTASVPSIKFGTPGTLRSNTYGTQGFCTTRFAQPRAVNRFHYPATGFSSTNFGTPVCTARFLRVTGIAPGTRFGTPLLLRNPECIDGYFASSIGVVTRYGQPRA